MRSIELGAGPRLGQARLDVAGAHDALGVRDLDSHGAVEVVVRRQPRLNDPWPSRQTIR